MYSNRELEHFAYGLAERQCETTAYQLRENPVDLSDGPSRITWNRFAVAMTMMETVTALLEATKNALIGVNELADDRDVAELAETLAEIGKATITVRQRLHVVAPNVERLIEQAEANQQEGDVPFRTEPPIPQVIATTISTGQGRYMLTVICPYCGNPHYHDGGSVQDPTAPSGGKVNALCKHATPGSFRGYIIDLPTPGAAVEEPPEEA